jgi:LPS O-antigen subunit length determinant protein (WzzB/FepE family)
MTDANPTEKPLGDEIDFNLLFSILWQRRKLIVFGTLVATLLSIAICLLIPRVYLSEGVYQLGYPKKMELKNENMPTKESGKNTIKNTIKNTASIGVPIPIYKISSAQFFNPNRFQLNASQDKYFDEDNLKEIRVKFRTPDDINKWIKPIYAYAKEDVREFSQLPKDESNSVIGLTLVYEGESPSKAHDYVNFFGNYIRDCLLYVTLYNYVMNEYSNTISDIIQNENDIIETQFKLQQDSTKMKDIRAILTNYPESEKIENRQLVSVQEGGDRFLSPTTQLVGIESVLADLRRKLAQLERDKDKLTIREEYFSRCSGELTKINERGEPLFLLLKSIKDEVFKSKDYSKDTVKEVFNNLSMDMQIFELAFLKNSRFISGPTIPISPIKPQKVLIVIVSCLISFFLFVILAFVWHWWQSNKKTIMTTNSRYV